MLTVFSLQLRHIPPKEGVWVFTSGGGRGVDGPRLWEAPKKAKHLYEASADIHGCPQLSVSCDANLSSGLWGPVWPPSSRDTPDIRRCPEKGMLEPRWVPGPFGSLQVLLSLLP